MTHTDARAALLHLAADDTNISNATLKRSLDLLAYLDIEELEVESITSDDWGAVSFGFAAAGLPRLAVHGRDVTALQDTEGDLVAKLINAITCAYEADDLTVDEDDADLEEG